MSINLSQQKRERLLNNIKIMRRKLIENPELVQSLADIESELKRKKYGLNWEEHIERVDEEITTKIPVFKEDKQKEIKLDNEKPINFLIEGDNLHSLYLLEKTHKEKIDVIYIDPPYNTENRDFVYDDNFIVKEDGFRHSKWLSFMSNRLRLAQKLLNEKGIIFISIDDNELYQLKLMCDEILGESNFVANLVWRKKYGGGKGTNFVVDLHEYILIYAKNKDKLDKFLIDRPDEKKEIFKLEDEYVNERGKYYIRPLKSGLALRPTLIYPIKCPDGSEIKTQWICAKDTFEKMVEEGRIVFKKLKDGKYNVYKKFYERDKSGYIMPDSILYDIAYNQNGKEEIKRIFNITEGRDVPFNNAKPTNLIKYLINFTRNKNALVLDFFAGSGTTGHSVLELNNEDNGSRRFILCTNNENKICEEITYNRIKTVITGKRIDNTKYSEGINANLKYYKTEYIDRFNHEDEGYYIVNELSGYIKELVQLENGMDINNKSVQVLFTDEEIDEFSKNDDLIKECKILYIDTNALITDQQMEKFEDNNIKVLYIPEYYFEEEIMEVEQW